MKLADKPERFGEHDNAFGFLRLLFASLVIVSHTPEIVDGDPHREVLHWLTGGMTFGGFAVYGFFVISGYLITGSYLKSGSTGTYLIKRIARIYPAFIVASLFSLLVVAPAAGAYLEQSVWRTAAGAVAHVAILARPMLLGAFAGTHYAEIGSALNGAMWTIQYEFACYLLVIALGAMGLIRRPMIVGSAALLLVVLAGFIPAGRLLWLSNRNLFPGPPAALFEMIGMFLAGSTFYLIGERVGFSRISIPLASVAFVALLFIPQLNGMTYAVLGSYLIFAAARFGARTWLGKVNNETDISYGLYLYAWPVEQLLIWYKVTDNLFLLGALTWLLAAMLGWLSWIAIEKPALWWARKHLRAGTARAPSTPVQTAASSPAHESGNGT
ncbi:acyltransferase family protein [uncultured Sphingomonas sp.]|uniref:acyltransferase family protein n=1 Tax=uncultured Sphingomonas sp. TaxID=158754 RepID=UPI0035CC657D